MPLSLDTADIDQVRHGVTYDIQGGTSWNKIG
jgi:hypothetical protein